jgi:hypothetical protein
MWGVRAWGLPFSMPVQSFKSSMAMNNTFGFPFWRAASFPSLLLTVAQNSKTDRTSIADWFFVFISDFSFHYTRWSMRQ